MRKIIMMQTPEFERLVGIPTIVADVGVIYVGFASVPLSEDVSTTSTSVRAAVVCISKGED